MRAIVGQVGSCVPASTRRALVSSRRIHLQFRSGIGGLRHRRFRNRFGHRFLMSSLLTRTRSRRMRHRGHLTQMTRFDILYVRSLPRIIIVPTMRLGGRRKIKGTRRFERRISGNKPALPGKLVIDVSTRRSEVRQAKSMRSKYTRQKVFE